MKKIVQTVIFLMCTIVSAQDETIFQSANDLYNQEKYQEAIDGYKSILNHGQESAALYYNLANAHYKLSNIGPSVYYYEKALELAPNDEDIKNNLVFAKNATIDAIDVMPDGVITRIMKGITNVFSYDTWSWISVISIILFVLLFILYHKSATSLKKRLFFGSAWLILIIGLLGVFFSFKQFNAIQNNQYAIVFVQETSIKSEPNLRSEDVFELHEGTKVKVTETVNDWKKIKLADGKIGWIPAADIKEL